MSNEVRRGPGRPRKIQVAEVETIADLVQYPERFKNDMRHFLIAGNPYRLRKWFVAAGDPERARKIKNCMLEWFDDNLEALIPKYDETTEV